MPTPELLDAAYQLCKEGWIDDKATEELARRVPGSDRSQFAEALARANALIDAACGWADDIRGPKNDGTGISERVLETECPGFSPATYADARSHGFYLTK